MYQFLSDLFQIFMVMHIFPFVTMHIHHSNGEGSLVGDFMLADNIYIKR